jgi:hypothetical protein
MEAVARGDDPANVVRDDAENVCIRFPNDLRDQFVDGQSVEAIDARLENFQKILPALDGDPFFLMAGQPDHVRAQWCEAMGLVDTRWAPAE